MRLQATFLVLLFPLVTGGTSWAEKVRTNANAKVYNRPGEQGQVVVKVKEGQAMTVIGKEGRWLKVRVSGRTGYIPRTKVDMPEEDDDIVRNTRRRPFVDGRSTKRGFGNSSDSPDDRIGADAVGGSSDDDDDSDKPTPKPKAKPKDDDGGKVKPKAKPASKPKDDDEDSDEDTAEDEDKDDGDEVADDRPKARVSAKVAVYSEPDKASDTAFTAKPSDTLFIESTKGKWTEVSVEEGDIGWIQTNKLDMVDGGSSDGGGGGGGKRIIDVRARLGWTRVSQKLSSTGGSTMWPDAGSTSTSTFAVSLGGTVLVPYKKRFRLGGQLTYDVAAGGGVNYDDGSGAARTGFTIHQVNARFIGGYDFGRPSGLALFGRLAYHYESFRVADFADLTKNTARLPQQNVKGPMIGVALAVPRLTQKLGFEASLDAMAAASVSQTRFLEDGVDPAATRIAAGAMLVYHWRPRYDLGLAYALDYTNLSFGAPVADSQINHGSMVTSSSRQFTNHTLTAGVSTAF